MVWPAVTTNESALTVQECIKKKKAARCLNLAAFVVASGGLASIERCLETPMNARFCVFKIDFAPPFVPPVCL